MPTPSLLIVPARFKSGKLYSQIPTSGAGDFTVTRNTAARRFDSAGLVASVASGIPRLDYYTSGGVTGCPALLVEPAATNSIRNNSMVGAVAGSPGTLPTNWSNQLGGGITQTIVGTGTENGVSYIDIRFSGTQNNTTPTDIRFESTTQIVASNGQTWSESVWLKIVAAPNPPTDYRLYMFERDSGGVFIKSATQVASLTTTLTRYSFTRALDGGATVARVQPALTFTTANGSTYDFTIRIGYPQMEQSSVATSVIPTTTGSVTRNADVVSVTGAVSGSIGQTEGTIYAEVAYSSIAATKTIISITDGTANNRIAIRINSTTLITARIVVAGTSSDYNVTIPAIPSSGILKISLAYKADDYVFAINGTIYASTTTRPVPATNAVTLGNNGFGTDFLNDRIRAAALYTTRLTNAELAALTNP